MDIGRRCRIVAAALFVVAMSACGRGDPDSFVASAKSSLAKSDYKAAIIELKNALKDAPDDAQARFLLATALLQLGEPVAAEMEVRKAIALNYAGDETYPVLARALLAQGEFKKVVAEVSDRQIENAQAKAEVLAALGTAHLGLGQQNEARAAISAALALKPDSVNARVAQVRLAALDNDIAGALRLAEAVIVTAPNDVDALLLKAALESAQGDRGNTAKTLERVIAIKPDVAAPQFALIANYVQSGQLDKAATQLESVRRLVPKDPRTYHAEALIAYASGNMGVAREAIQKAVQVAPDYLPSRYLSGLVDLRMGSYGTAEDALRLVVAKAPEDDGARRALAATYLRRGRATQAMETLEPALLRRPADAALLRMTAEVFLALNNPAKSTEHFERANTLEKGNVAGQVRLAQVRLASGDSGQALKDLEALAASESTASAPDLALVAALVRQRQFDKALAAAASLERKFPADPLSYNVKGVVYIAKRDFAGARASFEKALEVDPAYFAAAYNLARLDTAQGNPEAARKRYEQLLAKDPKNEAALLAVAELLALSKAPPGDIRDAIERAIAANPSSERARLTLISYHGRLRDWKAALVAAQAAQAALPDNPRILEALGATQNAAGETHQAMESLRRAAELQPNNAAPLMRLASMQVAAKDYDGAIRSLRSALAAQPDHPGVWLALAGAYVDGGRVDAGIAESRKLQKDRPDRAVGFALEGGVLARQKKWSDAATAYRAALARQPTAYVVIQLDSALRAAGKPFDAAAMVQKWLKDHPNDVTVRTFLADRSLAGKDYRGAVPPLRDALAIEPDNVALLNNLAWALSELGDPTAREHAERAYALSPEAASIADTYGWVLVRHGDAARGVELLRRASSLAPGNSNFRLHLAKGLLKIGDKSAAKQELEVLAKPESPPGVRAEAENLLSGL